MPGTGRYAHFAERLLTTSTRPFVVARTRAAAIELVLALALLMVLPAVANAISI
jgi:hypothetical protein